jgi:hypothetical protein
MSINKRVRNGLTLKGNYTWAHSLGMYGTGDTGATLVFPLPEMRRRNYGNSLFDVRHNLEMSYIYELPFGKGRKFVTTGLASKVAGGWQLNGIFAAYSGRPFNVTSSSTACNCPLGANTFTADQIKPNVTKLGYPEQWFDKTAFAPVTRRTGTLADFGNMNVQQLFAPGMVNLDTSVFRDFRVTERFGLQFRGELFNITNTPHFNAQRQRFDFHGDQQLIRQPLCAGRQQPHHPVRAAIALVERPQVHRKQRGGPALPTPSRRHLAAKGCHGFCDRAAGFRRFPFSNIHGPCEEITGLGPAEA